MRRCLGGGDNLPGLCLDTKAFQTRNILFRSVGAVVRRKDIFKSTLANAGKYSCEIAYWGIGSPDDTIHVENQGFDL
jgi:hypothetical protein